MRELKPLTVSKSIRSAPSVLLTQEMERFTFVQPLYPDFLLAQNVYTALHKHFKVEALEVGVFKLKGVNYICAEEPEGLLIVDDWSDYLWSTKRKFNRLLNPSALFKMYLINLFFPVFPTIRKFILPGKKDRFVVDAYPYLVKGKGICFKAVDMNSLGLFNPDLKKLFKYMHKDLRLYFEEFKVLHHEKLYTELKYIVSLYPSIRNEYWNELKRCFEADFKVYANAEVENYLLKL